MAGATVTAIMLIQSGLSVPVYCGVFATGFVGLVSALLFRVKWRKGTGFGMQQARH
jgi:hypothetical protein